MKKTFYAVVAMVAFSASGFANNEVKEVETPQKDEKKEVVGQACCRRGASNSNGENVSVRACVSTTGDAQIDMGKACEKAMLAAKAALAQL